VYDFVFIANEASDALLADKLAVDDNISTLNKLRGLQFDVTAFDAGKDIPMVTHVPQVRITADDTYQTPDMAAAVTDTWTVPMQRAAVRLQLTITLTPSQYVEWSEAGSKISISGRAQGVYLLPGIDNSADQIAEGNPYTADPEDISDQDQDNKSRTVTYDRIILPELFLLPANNKVEKVMKLSMTFGTGAAVKTKEAMVKVSDPDD
jgi:hypothetical protein